ncbi:antitoxin Xre/MbcA/ParS toxin-binding domain-containing protein [Sphingomonas xinjiangensis]|uniref:Antitoxin Xre/MbcA/ParS-like toxin-binding domain-containing protein n=1 Tax=Sphingomonas xinjiangensis TaxID=643568 RepID=A0A840YG95_9SPHN|nr:antitoxin Xre/MbcA/ParS toxin-binding domain-containing protein [Sphingomonas xinjiangensis]MBB5711864.1 hypothetical protein [Sphingomonas xinjiangensis]
MRARLLVGAQLVGWTGWHVRGNRRPVMSIEARRAVTTPAVRVFRGISKAWRLDVREEVRLLGLPRPVWSEIARGSPQALTTEALRRIAFLAGVFEAINTLFPPERADAWMRAPNAAPMFGGRSALDLMVETGPPGVRAVRLYLQGELYG